ncbi:GntR family transcriptional regulator, transcriptional repressor for pyruvate dehydrogenase complex [Paenibacillus sp. UNCCL117]|uniref:FadR/GntR family transcriptional regulator n=1 Tax=unclassified Paenibacillus TaxID=185978 RepID=UPI00087ED968|nr:MULTISPECIES: FadR/GntR family transcriptional regulator [unclassified Paenibacillus]SDC06320.1 GntR family transcriptional regulator, transcriptional repressor for pyruvate dehydrogenase complex [Paenibacillus sp. cl123]SFW37792.1 GntR family transcriptional regulator, transcriptional repressor for pyruvate dehydrogenase complex [Paenibacillus sp. UNCCL117]
MDIQKITTRKIYEVIADQIKDQITGGQLKPGDKLPSTKELSERFQVGRSTVREALSALKAMGLVEIHQGEGSYVRTIDSVDVDLPEWNSLLMSRETILDLLEARQALEIANAGLAAEKRNEEDLRRFEAVLERMERHLGDEEEGERSDIEFHLTLAQATHNDILARMIDSISSPMQLAIRETRRLQMYGSRAVSEQLWKEHQAVYEAIRDGKAEEAREQMRRHLFHVERVLVTFLQK